MTRDHFLISGKRPIIKKNKTLYLQTREADAEVVLDDLFILTGLGARGLCSAPLLAKLLARLINHEPLPFNKEIVDKMSVSRQWLSCLKKVKR